MQLLYNITNASVTNNGYMFEFFSINKGVRVSVIDLFIHHLYRNIIHNNRSFENLITTLEQFGKHQD